MTSLCVYVVFTCVYQKCYVSTSNSEEQPSIPRLAEDLLQPTVLVVASLCISEVAEDLLQDDNFALDMIRANPMALRMLPDAALPVQGMYSSNVLNL